MEAKKSPKADLENKKGLYFEFGMVFILLVALVAFNVKSYDKEEVEFTTRTAIDEVVEVVLQTMEEELPPPPPPEPEQVVTELVIVDDNKEIENEVGIVDMSDNANLAQEEYVAPEIVEEEAAVEEEIFVFVEENPSFPGGEEEMYNFLRTNIKYPELARDNGITGKVYVRFVVEKDGSITNAKAMRDIGGGCGAEAVRVVKSMPKWKPGKQRGKAVRAQFDLPVSFNLK